MTAVQVCMYKKNNKLEKLDLYRDNKMPIICKFIDFL